MSKPSASEAGTSTESIYEQEPPMLTRDEYRLIGNMVNNLPTDRPLTQKELADIHTALFKGGVPMTRSLDLVRSLNTVSPSWHEGRTLTC